MSFRLNEEVPIRCVEHRVKLIFVEEFPIEFHKKLEAIKKRGMLDPKEDLGAPKKWLQQFDCPVGHERRTRTIDEAERLASRQKLAKLFI